MMKKILMTAFLAAMTLGIISCDSNQMTQTESGLQYRYITKGNGQKVEKGSFVEAKLSLMVEDSVVWTTNDSPDSLFSFVVGYSGVIRGFEEMALLMREGDNVYVSIPDSLAYGDQGAGGVIPPNATIVYDRYELVSVSKPKKMLADTLAQAFQAGGEEAMMACFDGLAEADRLDEYHLKLGLMENILGQFTQVRQFATVEALTKRLQSVEMEGDQNMLNYYEIVALQGQGKLDEALTKAKALQTANPGEQWIDNMVAQLEAQSQGQVPTQ